MNILILDDEQELLELYTVMLDSMDHEITALESSEDGMKLLGEKKFDLIITDKKMPKYTGLDILKFVEETSVETPVFIITGDGDTSDEISFKNTLSRVFKKPIEFNYLFEEVEKLAYKI